MIPCIYKEVNKLKSVKTFLSPEFIGLIRMANYIGCTICGLRFIGRGDEGCNSCGSSLICLEKDLSPEVEKILREHGQRPAESEKEFQARKKKKLL